MCIIVLRSQYTNALFLILIIPHAALYDTFTGSKILHIFPFSKYTGYLNSKNDYRYTFETREFYCFARTITNTNCPELRFHIVLIVLALSQIDAI